MKQLYLILEYVEHIGLHMFMNVSYSRSPDLASSTNSNKQIPIIASGGIFTAEDAKEKLNAGASLVQVYTGFIYEGPGIAKKICEGLLK